MAIVVIVAAMGFAVANLPAIGARAEGARLARMEQSPQWGGDRFVDVLPRIEPEPIETMRRWFGDTTANRFPAKPVAVLSRKGNEFETPPESGLRVTWLGHSTLLVEIDGTVILVDPLWGEYVAPFEYEGARRFYPPPLPFDELPKLDAVLISQLAKSLFCQQLFLFELGLTRVDDNIALEVQDSLQIPQ